MTAAPTANFYLYAQALEEAAARALAMAAERDLTIATAESCTGGALAALLTDIEGLSHVFDRGFAVYCDAAKTECLGVSSQLLQQFGAVSREAAEAMARGALERSGAQLALSITGYAGPAGPNEEEGLVFICAMVRDGDQRVGEHHFGSVGRTQVRILALEKALELLEWAAAHA